MFKTNGYSVEFFNRSQQNFLISNTSNGVNADNLVESFHEYPLITPCLDKNSRQFFNKFSKII